MKKLKANQIKKDGIYVEYFENPSDYPYMMVRICPDEDGDLRIEDYPFCENVETFDQSENNKNEYLWIGEA